MADNTKQYITPETKAKLEEELNALIAHRPVVAAEINERREEGDLKENAGYDAAREMQDQEEARIWRVQDRRQARPIHQEPLLDPHRLRGVQSQNLG